MSEKAWDRIHTVLTFGVVSLLAYDYLLGLIASAAALTYFFIRNQIDIRRERRASEQTNLQAAYFISPQSESPPIETIKENPPVTGRGGKPGSDFFDIDS